MPCSPQKVLAGEHLKRATTGYQVIVSYFFYSVLVIGVVHRIYGVDGVARVKVSHVMFRVKIEVIKLRKTHDDKRANPETRDAPRYRVGRGSAITTPRASQADFQVSCIGLSRWM